MALGSDSVVTLVASVGDLHTVSTASVFDRELKLRGLAALRERSKLGALAARIKQGGYTRDEPLVVTRWSSKRLCCSGGRGVSAVKS